MLSGAHGLWLLHPLSNSVRQEGSIGEGTGSRAAAAEAVTQRASICSPVLWRSPEHNPASSNWEQCSRSIASRV